MDMDCFYSIQNQRTTNIKIKRSVFICTMAYADSIDQAKTFISAVSRENQTANHNCWAYIIGEKGGIFHSSDAGEPSGTAGKPMLSALQNHDMTNVAVVVTRYFGGVKLGVRGLIDAYSESVSKTIALRKLKKLVQTIQVCVEVSYEFNDTLLNQVKSFIVRVLKSDYSDKVVHTVEFDHKNFQKIEKMFLEYQSRELIKYSVLE